MTKSKNRMTATAPQIAASKKTSRPKPEEIRAREIMVRRNLEQEIFASTCFRSRQTVRQILMAALEVYRKSLTQI